jgi:hypothetical protein
MNKLPYKNILSCAATSVLLWQHTLVCKNQTAFPPTTQLVSGQHFLENWLCNTIFCCYSKQLIKNYTQIQIGYLYMIKTLWLYATQRIMVLCTLCLVCTLHVWCCVPYVWCCTLMSGVAHHMPGVVHHIPGVAHRMSGVEHHGWCCAEYSQLSVSSFRCPYRDFIPLWEEENPPVYNIWPISYVFSTSSLGNEEFYVSSYENGGWNLHCWGFNTLHELPWCMLRNWHLIGTILS